MAKIKASQLIETMLFHLNNLKRRKAQEVTEETKFDEVLGADSIRRNAFRNLIRWTVKANKAEDKPWPGTWYALSVKALAEKLVVLLLVFLPAFAQAQLKVDLSTIKTDNKDNAVAVVLTYVRSLDSMFKINDILVPMKKSLFAMTPEFVIQTGTADAFSSLTAKATGMFMFFKTTEVSGLITPDTRKSFSIVPFSVGVETNNRFNVANVIVETGYVPWYQTGPVPDWLKATKIGFYAQAGYKMNWDSAVAARGGQIDESEEEPNEFLFRLKTSAEAQITAPVTIGGQKWGLVGSGDLWFDLDNKATYYRYNATARLFVDATKYIDLIYQKGSGAPNFNQGDQYGVGFTIVF